MKIVFRIAGCLAVFATVMDGGTVRAIDLVTSSTAGVKTQLETQSRSSIGLNQVDSTRLESAGTVDDDKVMVQTSAEADT